MIYTANQGDDVTFQIEYDPTTQQVKEVIVEGTLIGLSVVDLVVKTPDEITTQYATVIQEYLDSIARACLYDNITSLCTYYNSTDPIFAGEGVAGCAWRDACWRVGYQVLDDVVNGLRTIPTPEELLLELPPVPQVLRMSIAARDGVTLEEDATYGAENLTLWQTIKSWFA